MVILVKYLREDSGNCRTYYRDGLKRLYCLQKEWPGVFVWMCCTRDGEPIAKVRDDVEVLVVVDLKGGGGAERVANSGRGQMPGAGLSGVSINL